MKTKTDPMYRYAFDRAARCRATSKRTGLPCRAPAVRGAEVCRFHGAGGGGPRGRRNGAFRHGRYTEEQLETRRRAARLVKDAREQIARMVGAGARG
jgi:hypothetical protein